MAKKKEDTAPMPEAQEKETAATMPEFKPEMAKLSPTQQRVAEFVKTANPEPPEVEVGKDFTTKIAMEIPKEVIRGPEYSYAWLAIDGIDQHLHTGSKWELVTRSNHGYAPERFFGLDGAITFKGQNILAFCHRHVQEAEQAAIVSDYNKKTERITEPQEQIKEGEVARLGNIKAAGRAVQANELNPDETYDFAEP